ncbi:hypothetical protein MKK88_16195 [Methylobacterium sp. E-005]|uniref:hypothetical protein n=1 Tax=Methylobacterium sp. E-005 TaxID=2836549 RepID=UPI001FBBFFBD|nr:hypothetical protein [Methylobacterium sp. E-005]MCJ2087510.1 hypothetical protein [Methylobacterium sp. E-005]
MTDQDNLDEGIFRGAMLGARAGLGVFGIEADDEICSQVAISVLTAFALSGGLEPESLERLRDIVVRASEIRRN